MPETRIVRYLDERDGRIRVGVRGSGPVIPIADGMTDLLRKSLTEIVELVETTSGGAGESSETVPAEATLLLPPVDDSTEVWAAGVTYERSRSARAEESTQASVYDEVYTAERPELFVKAIGWRVVTDAEPIGIREDSGLDVPEPELGVVVNADREIVGYVVCNDVSSRAIEGANPLYLPQAKVYAGGCAIGPEIRPAWSVDPTDLTVRLRVDRNGEVAWQGETSTAQLRRGPADLVSWLFAGETFPDGVVLSTGTGVIPEMDFTLRAEDVVRIEIGEVGSLSNRVVVGAGPLAWLAEARTDPSRRKAVRR